MKDAEAIVLRTGIRITKELLDLSEDLWTISRTGGGVDNVDVDAATEKGILVTSSLGVNATTVVEHCLALITALFKQLILMDREVRNENFRVRYKNLPRDLRGKCLGVVGFGRIGSKLARACNEIFNMRILANDAYLDEKKKKELGSWVRFTALEELFKEADVISLHIPLSEETDGLIDWKYLSLMKSDAFIINTSRGGVINEGDLIKALQQGLINMFPTFGISREIVQLFEELVRKQIQQIE